MTNFLEKKYWGLQVWLWILIIILLLAGLSYGGYLEFGGGGANGGGLGASAGFGQLPQGAY